MLIEVKHWQSDLQVGDLTYYQGTLLKVTRRYENKAGDLRTVKFRKIGKVKLTPWRAPRQTIPEHMRSIDYGGKE